MQKDRCVEIVKNKIFKAAAAVNIHENGLSFSQLETSLWFNTKCYLPISFN